MLLVLDQHNRVIQPLNSNGSRIVIIFGGGGVVVVVVVLSVELLTSILKDLIQINTNKSIHLFLQQVLLFVQLNLFLYYSK